MKMEMFAKIREVRTQTNQSMSIKIIGDFDVLVIVQFHSVGVRCSIPDTIDGCNLLQSRGNAGAHCALYASGSPLVGLREKKRFPLTLL